MNEAIARLEAKLRGGVAVFRLKASENGNYWAVVVERSEWPATDPATAEGAWEWVRLANLVVGPWKQGDEAWRANPYMSYGVDTAADPIAAVAAAVEALAVAESEAAARTS